MDLLEAVDRSPQTDLERFRSRESAVRRIIKGVWVSLAGWFGVVAVPIADFVFGAGQLTQEVWSIAARSLVWLGVFVAASAGTHLLRYGGKRGKLAFASLLSASGCGLVAVAEQFESWFLKTEFLRGLDVWGLAGAALFFGLAMFLLRDRPQENRIGDNRRP